MFPKIRKVLRKHKTCFNMKGEKKIKNIKKMLSEIEHEIYFSDYSLTKS